MAAVIKILTVERLERLGLSLRLDPDGLMTITPSEQITPELGQLIRTWRSELAAELLMHTPQHIPWDALVADAVLRRTAEAFGRLAWPDGLIVWAQAHAPDLWVRYQAAEDAVNAAYAARDMARIAQACRNWWQTLRLLVTQHAAIPPQLVAKEELSHV